MRLPAHRGDHFSDYPIVVLELALVVLGILMQWSNPLTFAGGFGAPRPSR